jgi:hypothetical protein
MADVFVSYAREDRFRAAAVVNAIAEHGWTVWWDDEIQPGDLFSEVIQRELAEARCVVVLWSRSSVRSEFVVAEAAEGGQRQILIPAILEDVSVPLEFRCRQSADLTAWRPGVPSTELQELLEAIVARLGKSTGLSNAVPQRSTVKQQPPRRAAIAFVAGMILVLILQAPQDTIKREQSPTASASSPANVHDAAALDAVVLDDMRRYGDSALDSATLGYQQVGPLTGNCTSPMRRTTIRPCVFIM